MANRIQRAAELRRMSMISASALPDEDAATVPSLFPAWATAFDYDRDDRVCYRDLLYRCLTAHTSQDSWTPDAAPSLWVRVDDPAEEWPDWRQPAHAEEAYPKDAKVTHNSLHWISDLDNNVWVPGEYGWTQVD